MTKGVALRESRDSNILNAEVSISTDISILYTVYTTRHTPLGTSQCFDLLPGLASVSSYGISVLDATAHNRTGLQISLLLRPEDHPISLIMHSDYTALL
jgi:hypothetical protein